MEYDALQLSQHVQEILKTEGSGVIHSVFNSSFNVQFGECLIHVGPIENGLSPFGIGMSSDDAKRLIGHLTQNDTVAILPQKKTLQFSKNQRLSLEHGQVFNPLLTAQPVSIDVLLQNRSIMIRELIERKWIGGLVHSETEQAMILQYLQQSETAHIGTKTSWLEEIMALESLVNHRADERAKEVFDFWIGRGPGLTPSGDDMMTGICASLYLLEEAQHTPFISSLTTYLTDHGKKRTTPVAYEYLLYATKGNFHSTILHMCFALRQENHTILKQALEQMEQIGHTSGVDTLLGMLIGLKAGITLKS